MARAPLSVLIVEDDRSIARMLHLAVAHYGATPTVVHTAAAALQLLASTAYAVVLTDYGLPDMTGVMLIHQIRQSITPLPALILISGHPQGMVTPQIHTLALTAYLAKPFTIPALYQVLDTCYPDTT
jgi:CheY-like chemotaxis protein